MSSRFMRCFACEAEAPEGPFVEVDADDDSVSFDELRAAVQACADERGEAVGVAVQENVGAFSYVHAERGGLRRALAYNYDAGWFHVEGTPEPWEAERLFGAAERARLLADYGDDPGSVAAIEAAWERKRIAPGSFFPSVDAELLAAAVLDALAA